MMKEVLKESIIKELMLVRRLATKVQSGTEGFRPKEGVRSTIELIQYLSICGTTMLRFWQSGETEPRPFLQNASATAPIVTLENAVSIFDAQITLVEELFENISEEDITRKEIIFPWGNKGLLGAGLVETSIKWLAAYKLQLFMNIKLSSDENLATPDLWRKTEIEMA